MVVGGINKLLQPIALASNASNESSAASNQKYTRVDSIWGGGGKARFKITSLFHDMWKSKRPTGRGIDSINVKIYLSIGVQKC